jgi:hypothetical protein
MDWFLGCPVQRAEDDLKAALREVLPEDHVGTIMARLEQWVDEKISKATRDDSGWDD